MDRSGSIVGALVVIVGGCGADELPPPPGMLCSSGDVAPCTCKSGLSGTMVCLDNGRAFDDCECNMGGDGGVVSIATGRGTVDAPRPAPPDCELATAQWQVMQACTIGAPPILYECPNGAPPDSFGCLQPNSAHPLWCCP